MKTDFYTQTIANLRQQLEQARKRSDRLSWVRLLVFVAGCALSYLAYSLPTGLFVLTIVLSFIVLMVLIKRHSKVDVKIERLKRLIQIYENELPDTRENIFGTGEQYIDDGHAYSSDLDVFGRSSLFAYINRTVTHEGSERLAHMLLTLPTVSEVQARQQLARELAGKQAYKEGFLSSFFLSKSPAEDAARVRSFIENFEPFFQTKPWIRMCAYLLPLVALSLFVLSFINPALWAITVPVFVFNMLFTLGFTKQVNKLDNHIGNQAGLFRKYATLVRLIKQEHFQHLTLQAIQSELVGKVKFDQKLAQLARLSDFLDYRKNLLVGFLFNSLLMWDIHCSYAVERWFRRNSGGFLQSLRRVGEMDAYLSLSIVHFNHPTWALPTVVDEYFVLHATELAHPLLPEDQRVANGFNLNPEDRVVILTGSNMSGKSTFLRTLGVNMLLAYAGAPVCAEAFTVSLASLQKYMRTHDSLSENTSSFYAELLRVKKIIDTLAHNNRCFLLLDELLKGTNSNDKYVGSVAIVKHLLRRHTTAIVATHDLALTDMQGDYPESILNYHFDITVEGEELYFSYKLREGVCRTFNAQLLLKKIGIEL